MSKSNARNLALFRRYALEPEASTTEHRLFFAGIGLVMLGLIWLVVQAVAWLIGLLTDPGPASRPRTHRNDRRSRRADPVVKVARLS